MQKNKFIKIGNLLFFKPGQISNSSVEFVGFLAKQKYTIYSYKDKRKNIID